MGEMSVINQTGDTKINWDSSKPDEVSIARENFEKFKKKGYRAFSVSKKGDRDEMINSFDPDLERILFIPPISGG